ncbi:fasciclin-like arabinogalactan protein 1 [Impatiens glandulifera]|uniref:fasciclin-like arabinogalactan protein 1 n=1 Tax=Impatiens glandulifera TaxID=253017 RepID=UPI001FB0A162|nr:fasciclin-like arabinogalactan protein 1 [Impatiens glandulifera]
MQLRQIAAVVFFIAAVQAHNITEILENSPEFSIFNRYLTATHVADEINRRETITVCVVNNAGMSNLIGKHLSINSMKNVLSFHVLLDYFDNLKLHDLANGTALTSTVFQATGSAQGASGFVNITDLKGGVVSFGTMDNGGKTDAVYVKSLKEIPYNISVIHISNVISSPDAEAPMPTTGGMNLTSVMSAHGCKIFAETLLAAIDAEKMFNENAEVGLTVFCPGDDAFKKFLPIYKKLNKDQQQSLMEYHATSVFLTMDNLKSSNGMMNTLATSGANKYDFEVKNEGNDVTLKTKVVTARITGTLIEEQPVAIYTIDKVLLPRELFKVSLAPTPAPSPEPVADSPRSPSPPSPDSPAPSPSPSTDDDQAAADSNSADRFGGGRFIFGVFGLWLFNLMI